MGSYLGNMNHSHGTMKKCKAGWEPFLYVGDGIYMLKVQTDDTTLEIC